MIHVIATIHLAPGQRDAFLKEFHALVPLVKQEQGCLDYGPTRDLSTGLALQMPMRGDVVTVVERWTDLEALKKHLQAPHMLAYRDRVGSMVLQVQLQVLEPC